MVKQHISVISNMLDKSLLLESLIPMASMYTINVYTSSSKPISQNYPFQIVELKSISQDYDFMSGLEERLEHTEIIIVDGDDRTYAFQALKAKKKFKNKLFVYKNNHLLASASHSPSRCVIHKEVVEHVDYFLTHNYETLELLKLEGIPTHKVMLLPLSVDQKDFFPVESQKKKMQLREDYNLNESDLLFLVTTPLEAFGGVFELLQGLKHLFLRKTYYRRRVKLLIASSGTQGTQLRQFASELDIDKNVIFTSTHFSKKADMYQLCDVYIEPIISDSNDQWFNYQLSDLGRAISCALPVIAVKKINTKKLINGASQVYLTGESKKIADLIEQLVETTGMIQRLGNQARKNAENYILYHINEDKNDLWKLFNKILSSTTIVKSDKFEDFYKQIEDLITDKNYLDALDMIENSLELEGLNITQQSLLHRHIGDCFTKLGDYENGQQSYRTCLQMTPDNSKALIGLGTIMLQQHKSDRALFYFQKAIRLSSSDEMAMLGMGLACQQLGEYSQAITWATQSLQKNIHNEAAIFTLTHLSYQANSFDEAETYLQQFVDVHKSNTHMIFSLAGIKYKLNKLDQARHLLHNILEINPTDQKALDMLSIIDLQEMTG